VISTGVSSTALYAALRVGQNFFPEPDPALVIWSEHAGYFWRAWIAAYVSGTAGFVTYGISARHATQVAHVLATGVLIATVLLVTQAMFVP
jgi:hypothetical protein